MYDIDITMLELKKYLRKLEGLISTGADFTFFNTKLVKKKLIDDLLCCIEATIPVEYKEFIKKKSDKRWESATLYYALKSSIQNRFMFSSSLYSVQYKRVSRVVMDYQRAMKSDLKYIQREYSNIS
jgi:hypothetical protein